MPNVKDIVTVKKTLKFLSSNLRTERFDLLRIIKLKKQLQYEENIVRSKIKNLQNRMQKEFDDNIELFKSDENE